MIDQEKATYPIALMCKILGVSRSGYYAWLRRPPTERGAEDAKLSKMIIEIHHESRGTYGSPRIHAELVRQRIQVGRVRVCRLMRKHGISGRVRRRFKVTTDSDHRLPIAPHLLDRDFDPASPNMVWAGDITYIRTQKGWLYLAVVLDLYSRRVVGWSMANHMRASLVINAMQAAVGSRGRGKSLMFHSDRGSQYASHDFRCRLRGLGITQSMSRVGNCWDNAVVESFFGTLKQELVLNSTFYSHEDARRAIHEYIEVFYNRRRAHSTLGYMSPAEFESCVA